VLPARERELVILRVGANAQSVYEFGQHTLIGRDSGITDDEVLALTLPADAHPWSEGDRDLIALADELCADDCVSDATWARLAGRWDDEALVELVVVAGFYRLVSGFLNSAGVQLDPGVPGWPEGAFGA
jgi:alkylhydroperoxidase family enzyme